jgi:hypothetical protein
MFISSKLNNVFTALEHVGFPPDLLFIYQSTIFCITVRDPDARTMDIVLQMESASGTSVQLALAARAASLPKRKPIRSS